MAFLIKLISHRKGTLGYAFGCITRLEDAVNSAAVQVLKQQRQRDLLIAHQRDQMFAGLDAGGEYISPYYSEDPYFHSKDSASRYAKWKKKLEPRQRQWPPYIKKQRPEDVPNLIINGELIYKNISLQVTQRHVKFELPAFNIRAKYGNVLGLSPLVLNHYRRRYFLPAFYAELSRRLL